MKLGSKITALACAGVLASMGVAPAFAADSDSTINTDGNSADVKISAAVAKANEKIISVTVPSQMAIAITTYGPTDAGKTEGAFKEATGSKATITNNEVSNADVKVEVAKVSQVAGVDQNAKLLDLVNMHLDGDWNAAADGMKAIHLAEGAYAGVDDPDDNSNVLFERITINSGADLVLAADALADDKANTIIPTDSYTVNATLKVTALEPETPTA